MARTPAPCQVLVQTMEARRAQFPVQLWKDEEHGRLVDWPAKGLTDEDKRGGWKLGLERTTSTTGRSFFVKGGERFLSIGSIQE